MSEAWIIIRSELYDLEGREAKPEKIVAVRDSADAVNTWLAAHPLTQRWGWDGNLYPSYRLERHPMRSITAEELGATSRVRVEHSTDQTHWEPF